MYVKETVTSCLLNMSVGFWLCLFIIKLHSQKDIFKFFQIDLFFSYTSRAAVALKTLYEKHFTTRNCL